MTTPKFPNNQFKTAYEAVTEGLSDHETMDRLTVFLYLLMRDHLSLGIVLGIVIDTWIGKEGPCQLSNGYVAKFAEHLAHKLRVAIIAEEEEEEKGENHSTTPTNIPNAFRSRQKDRGDKKPFVISIDDDDDDNDGGSGDAE